MTGLDSRQCLVSIIFGDLPSLHPPSFLIFTYTTCHAELLVLSETWTVGEDCVPVNTIMTDDGGIDIKHHKTIHALTDSALPQE